MRSVEQVSFKQVYDLVFRARNAKLNAVAYVLDFKDWVKAGVAYNTRGYDISTRKISFFAELYMILEKAAQSGPDVIEPVRGMFTEALIYYYEDIYSIYQDHLKSKQADVVDRRSKAVPDFGELLVLPSFDLVPVLNQVFETRTFGCETYDCKHLDAFLDNVNTAYLKEGSSLFRCMSLMYDYGVACEEKGVLLEVTLWDKT